MRRRLQSKYLPVSLIILAALLWSLDGVLRADLRVIPAPMLVALEHGLGLIFLTPWLILLRKQILGASRKAQTSLVLTAIVSGVLGTVFYTRALAEIDYVPFSVVVLMQQLQPLFAVTLAALVLREKIDIRIIVSGAFALLGAYLISFPELVPDLNSATGQSQALAAGLAAAAALAWGAGTVLSKQALAEIDFHAATAGRFLITFVAATILAVILGETASLGTIESSQWLQLLVIVFSAGMVALLLYYKGLSQTRAQVATFAELTWPLSAFAIDIYRGVDFTQTQIFGGIILLIMIIRIAGYANAEKNV
ncbi:MAG: DMT family transporter [Candidatus Dojkabacteria bacterium]